MALSATVTKSTVFGDLRVVFGNVTVTTTADELDTGLDYLFAFLVTNRDTLADGNDVQVVLNSNDGTTGTSAGEVFLDIEVGDTLDFMAIGK